MATIVLNEKLEKVNKILDHAKYITTAKFNKFTGSVFDTELKQANLTTNSDANAVT